MAVVKKYSAEVVGFINNFEDVYSVEFRSLAGKFRYLPGQFLHLALDEYDPSTGWPESRCFSIKSSPSDENINITFSVKGEFTSRMAREIHTGKIITLKLPYGELFQQEHSKENVVFIAGGTGITPFLSMFNDSVFNKYINPRLYLGIRKKKLNIYTEYLKKAKVLNPQFKIEIKYQDNDGLFSSDKIYNDNGSESTYFISGPPNMISNFKSDLISFGVPGSNIKSDDWK